MKLICQLAFNCKYNFFPKSFLLEGKKGYNLHTFKEFEIDKTLEIDADLKGNISSHPGIDGTNFEMFIKEGVAENDLISFHSGNSQMEILVYVKEVIE